MLRSVKPLRRLLVSFSSCHVSLLLLNAAGIHSRIVTMQPGQGTWVPKLTAGFVFGQEAPETLFLTAKVSAAIRQRRLPEVLATSTPGIRAPVAIGCQWRKPRQG